MYGIGYVSFFKSHSLILRVSFFLRGLGKPKENKGKKFEGASKGVKSRSEKKGYEEKDNL